MNIRARGVLAATGVAAILALAGCGGDDGGSTSTTPKSAAASTPPASSAPTIGGAAASASPGEAEAADDSLADVLSRAVQQGGSAHVTLDLGSRGSGEGDMVLGDGGPAMQLRLSFGGRTTEIRLVDGKVYVAAPGRDGKYMKLDVGRSGAALGIDPSQALDELEKRSGDFELVGDGHWRATHDGVRTDVLVGADGYPAKVQVAGAGDQTMTMTFSDWGQEVTVEAPAAGDLVAGPRI